MDTSLVWAPLWSLCLSAGLIWLMLKFRLAGKLALDRPVRRSLHSRAIPRSGGVGMFLAIAACGVSVAGPSERILILACLLSGFSFLDDRVGLPVSTRLAIHLVAAVVGIIPMTYGMALQASMLAILCIVWAANLYNFMDGSDGLAGGVGVIGFGFFGVACLLSGRLEEATLCLIVAMAVLGFLFFNFMPARIFMGDGGSVPLGYLAGVMGTWGWREGIWPLAFPLLVFFPFVADATLTLIQRLLRREKFWLPHREHCYQRLIRMGASHRLVACIYYGATFMTGASSLLLLGFTGSTESVAMPLTVFWFSLAVIAFGWIQKRWSSFILVDNEAEDERWGDLQDS